jgi:hypothetical protein
MKRFQIYMKDNGNGNRAPKGRTHARREGPKIKKRGGREES